MARYLERKIRLKIELNLDLFQNLTQYILNYAWSRCTQCILECYLVLPLIALTLVKFTSAICIIDMQIRGYALSGDGTLPKKLRLMRGDVKHFILPKITQPNGIILKEYGFLNVAHLAGLEPATLYALCTIFYQHIKKDYQSFFLYAYIPVTFPVNLAIADIKFQAKKNALKEYGFLNVAPLAGLEPTTLYALCTIFWLCLSKLL